MYIHSNALLPVAQVIYNFIVKSTKRHAVFEKIQQSTKNFCDGMVRLKSLSDTRWACRVEAVRSSLLDNFGATLSALQDISQTDADSGGQANALLKSMEDFHFVFYLLLLRRVLTQCNLSSKTLQSSCVTYKVVKSLKDSMLEVADKCGFTAVDLKSKGKIPAKIGGGSKAPFEIVQQLYKVTIWNPVIDVLEQEIQARLQENYLDVLNHLSQVLTGSEVHMASVQYVCKFYTLNKELLLSDLQRYYKMEE
ncbi:hypothetical protein PR048_016520 [Dryococelus australis]|uniref:Uncharacterized protein n=1 Tax=Dryococelus australis TaxID=614101 RepID=A0ABQ9HK81_9NEOP|nr:hypothetical protein PR048_016520 [Dryococelus australis]